jgi:hypothetical protein
VAVWRQTVWEGCGRDDRRVKTDRQTRQFGRVRPGRPGVKTDRHDKKERGVTQQFWVWCPAQPSRRVKTDRHNSCGCGAPCACVCMQVEQGGKALQDFWAKTKELVAAEAGQQELQMQVWLGAALRQSIMH